MADTNSFVAQYLRATERFNQGDVNGWGELITDDCTFEGMGHNRAEIVKQLQQNMDDGWVAHNPIGTVAAGDYLVGVYENVMADGTRGIGSGILRFNSDGQVVEIVGRGPAGDQQPV